MLCEASIKISWSQRHWRHDQHFDKSSSGDHMDVEPQTQHSWNNTSGVLNLHPPHNYLTSLSTNSWAKATNDPLASSFNSQNPTFGLLVEFFCFHDGPKVNKNRLTSCQCWALGPFGAMSLSWYLKLVILMWIPEKKSGNATQIVWKFIRSPNSAGCNRGGLPPVESGTTSAAQKLKAEVVFVLGKNPFWNNKVLRFWHTNLHYFWLKLLRFQDVES